MGKISPFAPKELPQLPVIQGVRLATAAAGIRYPGRTDLLLALFDPGTTVAGALTRSKTASAPVDWCRSHLAHGMARALVVNSGNANAFTGTQGRDTVKLTARAAAESPVKPPQTITTSTRRSPSRRGYLGRGPAESSYQE